MRPLFVRAGAATTAAVVSVLLASAAFAQESPAPMLSPPSNVAAPNVASAQPGANEGVSPRSPEKSDIQQLLADTVDAGVSKGELPALVSHLAKANQDKIGDLRDKQWSDLDGRIDAFRNDWRAKFGIDFKLADKQSVVFADDSFPIRPGNEASENSTGNVQAGAPTTVPATSAPVSMDTNPTGSGAMLAGNTTQPASDALPPPAAGQASAFPNVPPVGTNGGNGAIGGPDPARTEAMSVRTGTVLLPETPTAAVATIQLVNEGQVVPLWHIQLPNGVDAQRLHDALLSRLTKLDENAASWPTEINQAYQAVSREILAGLLDSGATTQP